MYSHWGKLIKLVAVVIIVGLFLPSVLSTPNLNNYDDPSIKSGLLETVDDITILHLKGNFYEMGYQHGSLLKDEIMENARAYLKFAEDDGTTYEELLELWNITIDFTPEEIIKEMQGMADGSGISFEIIALVNIMPMRFHCCGIAAWGDATVDSKLYHTRSLDYPLEIIDPETGTYLQENQIMIVREPEDGLASLYPGFAGFVGCLGGINSAGVSFGQSSSWCDDETDYGTPMTFRLKYVIDHATTAEEAIDIITTDSTCGFNYIVADSTTPIGYAVETTATLNYVGTCDNPTEDIYPCWSIKDVVRRTNFFIDPETAKTQRERYNPSSILLFIFGKNPDYPYWRHYQTLSRGIENNWGIMNLDSTMTMLRDVYNGRTDILVWIAQYFGMLQTMHQWVACPETGDMLVTFATPGKSAFKNTIHSYNLYNLIE